jgi:hypothetical protein
LFHVFPSFSSNCEREQIGGDELPPQLHFRLVAERAPPSKVVLMKAQSLQP